MGADRCFLSNGEHCHRQGMTTTRRQAREPSSPRVGVAHVGREVLVLLAALGFGAALPAGCDAEEDPLALREGADPALDETPAEEEPGVLESQEPPTPSFLATVDWGLTQQPTLIELDHEDTLPLTISVDSEAVLLVTLRADVDGAIHEASFGPTPLGLSTPWAPEVRPEDFEIDEHLRFSAMIEGKMYITRDDHTRVMPISPIFMHPLDGGGFALYGEELHETAFSGGDFRGSVPKVAPDGEDLEPVAHVSVARVRELPAGTDPTPE